MTPQDVDTIIAHLGLPAQLVGYAWTGVGAVKLYQLLRHPAHKQQAGMTRDEFRAELAEHREQLVEDYRNFLTLAIAEVRIAILSGGHK